jgi:sec-independent protein translocase protein TatB
MFDIGFAELVIIGVVGLLVIGPERLPGAVRTASLWISRLRRGFNDIKREVQQEIHNDSVMQELRRTGEQLKEQTDKVGQEIRSAGQSLIDTPEQTGPFSDSASTDAASTGQTPQAPKAADQQTTTAASSAGEDPDKGAG